MIKFGTRHNLLYPMMFLLFTGIRKIDSIMMKELTDFNGSLFLTLIMFIADFVGGIIVYSYHLKFLKEKEASKFMGIELIQAPSDISHPDSDRKIYLLLFLASFLDFAEYTISSYFIPEKIKDVSLSLEWRLKSIIICGSSFFCYYLLKIPIFKHQILSLITILICLVVVIITEIIEFKKNSSHGRSITHIIYVLFLMLINHIYNSCFDTIEKYLLEYDYINPYRMLMIEGFFGFFLSIFISLFQNPFKELEKAYNNEDVNFAILIFFLILYFLLSAGRNIYRVTTNKLYSPMTKALFDYILVPVLITYYYCAEEDFISDDKILYYFVINLIISIIIVFCGLIYNELIIIFCCNFEYDTHYEVSKRAKNIESHAFELSLNESSESNESSISNYSNSESNLLED